MTPQRIQRKRTKGWKMPENTVYVGRQNDGSLNVGEFGNPFKVGQLMKIGNGKSGFCWLHCIDAKYDNGSFVKVRDRTHAVELYSEYLSKYPLPKSKLDKLRGKNLACWCKEGEPCHADILLKLANQ